METPNGEMEVKTVSCYYTSSRMAKIEKIVNANIVEQLNLVYVGGNVQSFWKTVAVSHLTRDPSIPFLDIYLRGRDVYVYQKKKR